MTAQFEALKKPLGEPFVVLAKKKKLPWEGRAIGKRGTHAGGRRHHRARGRVAGRPGRVGGNGGAEGGI